MGPKDLEKMTILRPNFRKGLILKLNLSKHVLTKKEKIDGYHRAKWWNVYAN